MNRTIDIREKIAVRAYFAWLNGSQASAEAHWLEAEAIELAYAERRAAAARKAAETRRAKRAPKMPGEMLVAVPARRNSAHRPTAH